MTAGRAYDMGIELQTTIVTPEDSPLATLARRRAVPWPSCSQATRVEVISSAYAEVPSSREVVIKSRRPASRRRAGDRATRALWPAGSRHSAGRTRLHPGGCALPGPRPSSGSTQPATQPTSPSSTAASVRSRLMLLRSRSRRSRARPSTPERFQPRGPRHVADQRRAADISPLTSRAGTDSARRSPTPRAGRQPSKIVAKYLAPYLDERDREGVPTYCKPTRRDRPRSVTLRSPVPSRVAQPSTVTEAS